MCFIVIGMKQSVSKDIYSYQVCKVTTEEPSGALEFLDHYIITTKSTGRIYFIVITSSNIVNIALTQT